MNCMWISVVRKSQNNNNGLCFASNFSECSSSGKNITNSTYPESSRSRENILNSTNPNLSDDEVKLYYPNLSSNDIRECKKLFDGLIYTPYADVFIDLLKKHSAVNPKLNDYVKKKIHDHQNTNVFRLSDMYNYLNLHIKKKQSSSSLLKLFSRSNSKKS
ncbi:uncharacterized protein LOC126906720 isoform X3 [Daktulosphaira vitifoliae]|uniref:uncharacterized protein LOC126906720 isoform X2 n=1 Tax=Daktulosphaira vitifoliae TaxID=58002 RepID=UPI0021AA2117|nr:uncharacterized protein LOC126906720 isoform X2 [Daktulosphaira vitifoliae]XP_050543439.1 uncharacterized protein LOC126906720 isoform X3 [Daktulosphaira vitifoliae]